VLSARRAIKNINPKARFLHVEPLLHIVPPADEPELEDLAQETRNHQFQVWELLRGTLEPELGGEPEALDLMGVNYYYNGQMEVTGKHLPWEPPDPRRATLAALLEEVHSRYSRPLIIAETGHFDDARPRWLHEVLAETLRVMKSVPVQGVCIYPVIDRHCWHDPSKLIRCGLLDQERQHYPDYTKTLRDWQHIYSGQTHENLDRVLTPPLELRLPATTAPTDQAS
jgi:hypothetical protein